ncbi:MAG: DNA-3-methyladenine glycosylase 2 family protein [Deltaproteobacteria bacterium]|nr:DNA-3-methyladenine glycosylase 2 family protein [Deltaproteobacteria bacterium]
MTLRLNTRSLSEAVKHLVKKDRRLKRIVAKYGPPPLWERQEGFHTLILIILEQQVSLASAKATYEKLLDKIGTPTPATFLNLSDAQLRQIGFSRQKTAYGRILAGAVIDGSLDLSRLSDLGDAEVKQQLINIKGIGSWSADTYLLSALARPDIWPTGDLALASAVQQIMGLESRPSPEILDRIGLKWQPWRSVAARIFWHHYLSERNLEMP